MDNFVSCARVKFKYDFERKKDVIVEREVVSINLRYIVEAVRLNCKAFDDRRNETVDLYEIRTDSGKIHYVIVNSSLERAFKL